MIFFIFVIFGGISCVGGCRSESGTRFDNKWISNGNEMDFVFTGSTDVFMVSLLLFSSVWGSCVSIRCLFAGMLLDNFDTCLTFDVAAPMKFAVATFFDNDFFGVVAPATT